MGVFAVIGIAGVVFLLVAVIVAGIPVLTEGTVVDKTFAPARSEITTRTGVDGNGNPTTGIETHHHPEEWKLHVQGRNSDDEIIAEWWTVGAGVYERIDIGDYVYRNKSTGVVSLLGEGK